MAAEGSDGIKAKLTNLAADELDVGNEGEREMKNTFLGFEKIF